MFKTRGLQIRQSTYDLFVTSMTAHQLMTVSGVDRWDPTRDVSYQRPDLKRRHTEIANYLQREEGVLPTSILLSARPGASMEARQLGDDASPQLVELTFSDGCRLWIVDGQHRAGGLREAVLRDASYNDYPVPVTIMLCADTYTELRLFNVINTRQKPIPKDIVDQHLRKMRDVEGADMQAKTTRKDFIRARASAVVELLNALPSPWQNRVRIPNIPDREDGVMRFHSLVVSLEPILEDSLVRTMTDDQLAESLATYWNALASLMSAAFAAPDDYTVQSHVGVHVFHRLFPGVARLCQELNDFSQGSMERILRYPRLPSRLPAVDSNRWHRLYGDPMTRDARMGSMRFLADNVRLSLPPVAALRGH